MANTVTYDTSYAVVLGDLGPPLLISLLQNGSPFVLQETDAVTFVFKDDCGDKTLVSATIVELSTGQVAVHWLAGNLSQLGNLHGQVKVVRVGEDFPQTFPSIGTVDFKVTPPIQLSSPGALFVNDNAATIPQLAPVYQTAPGHCDLAAADTQAHATCVGLAYTAITSGASGPVISSGPVIAPTSAWDAITGQSGGLTPGAVYYLSTTTQGQLTSALPDLAAAPVVGRLTVVGVAQSSTMLAIAIQAPVGPYQRVNTPTLGAIMGDSNASGQAEWSSGSAGAEPGFAIGTPFAAVAQNVHVAQAYADPIVWIDTGTEALQPYQSASLPNMGIEQTLGRYLVNYGIDTAPTIVKCAVYGSTITNQWSPLVAPITGGNLYSQAVAYLQARQTEFGRPLDYLVWIDGSNEAPNSGMAATYQADLTALIASFRASLGLPNLLVVIVQLNVTSSSTYASLIRAAQAAFVASDARAVLVNVDDVPLHNDPHYDGAGYCTIGERVAVAIKPYFTPTLVTDLGAGPAPWYQQADCGISVGNATATVRSGAAVQVGDDEFLVCSAYSAATTISLTTAAGFTALGAQFQSVLSTSHKTMAVYWRKITADMLDANGRPPEPVVSFGGATQNFARIIGVRGANATNPIAGSAIGANNANNTTLSIASVTTTAPNCLLLILTLSNGSGGANPVVSTVNANLTGIAKKWDSNYTVPGGNHELAVITATMATAGATGTTAVTMTGAGINAGMIIAVQP